MSGAKIKGSSNRSFGLTFAAFFMLATFFPLFTAKPIRWHFLPAVLGFLFLALVVPQSLGFLNRIWTKFGLLLHSVTNPVIMGLIFFIAFAPLGLLLRVFGKDSLKKRWDLSAKTYWVKRQTLQPYDMKNQF
jgi:hypothetical protein